MKYFKSHNEFLNEAKLSAIHKAAKKGSYLPSAVELFQPLQVGRK